MRSFRNPGIMPAHPDTGPRPAALACAQCRSRHLKCDGGRPACRRCSLEGSECHYTPSRRGQRRRAQRRPSHGSVAAAAAISGTTEENNGTQHAQHFSTQQSWMGLESMPISNMQPEPVQDPGFFLGEHEATLIELYFTKFHQNHPILVPKQAYNNLPIPESLRSVVRFIGALL